jgi:phytoene dehydrogenase-like protein
MEPFVAGWWEFAAEVLRPMPRLPRHPLLLARFGLRVLPSARTLANTVFRTERAKALWAGIAAHSFLSHDDWLSTAFGMVLSIAAHAVGWPIPRGGAQSLSDALCAQLSSLGGSVKTSSRVSKLADLPESDLFMCDVTPRQLINIAGERFTPTFRRLLENYEYGPGVFKVDYALSSPLPWKAQQSATAATVHVGGTFEEIADSEKAMSEGRHAERPFVIVTQPSLFDSTRAPEGKHTAWAYCHVPNGSNFDMLGRIEDQIERFAPGFRDCVLGRKVFSPAALESVDSNVIGGDISGGRITVRQLLFRPTWRHYGTSARDIYICSSSTPPGGGVHGMCGYHAAKMALSKLRP